MLLHGQLRPREKAEAMERFAAGEADVLVATTVIEVGIDVPNATVMLVEDAERYGISQLHQLRGRVGRGEHASLCLLFGPKESRRLQALAQHGDGFALAEIDLELRGEGELTGTRQSGMARFRVARLPEDADVLERAHACAAELPRPSRRARVRAARRRAAAGRGEPRRPHEGDRGHAPAGGGSSRLRAATRARRPTGCASRSSRSSARWTASASSTSSPGSGALGIEALSRGAGSVLFCDDARPAIAAVRQNLDALGLDGEVVCDDARRVLRNAHGRGAAYDLIFLDPPYRQAERWAADLSAALPADPRVRAGASSARATGAPRSTSSSRSPTSAATATP